MNNEEMYDDYDDIEGALERQEVPEHVARIWRNMADTYLSQEQLADKGNLLGCYKSSGFLRTYIEVYERAFIGRVETAGAKKPIDIRYGYACLTEALVEEGTLYLIMNDEKIYRLRYIKKAEEAAYRMNEQRWQTKV